MLRQVHARRAGARPMRAVGGEVSKDHRAPRGASQVSPSGLSLPEESLVLERREQRRSFGARAALVLYRPGQSEQRRLPQRLHRYLRIPPAELREDRGGRHAARRSGLGDRALEPNAGRLATQHLANEGEVLLVVPTVAARQSMRSGKPVSCLPGTQRGWGQPAHIGEIADRQPLCRTWFCRHAVTVNLNMLSRIVSKFVLGVPGGQDQGSIAHGYTGNRRTVTVVE